MGRNLAETNKLRDVVYTQKKLVTSLRLVDCWQIISVLFDSLSTGHKNARQKHQSKIMFVVCVCVCVIVVLLPLLCVTVLFRADERVMVSAIKYEFRRFKRATLILSASSSGKC